jgi:hypothetical protein
MNSSDSSDNVECLTSSLLSLNNYKYDNDYEINIDITVNNFIKLTQDKEELTILLNNVKKNIYLLPEFMKYIKLCNHRLALNLMDNPEFCFEKIFDILFNKSNNIEDHLETIEKIVDIFPNYDKEYIFEILKSNNFIIEDTINYLFL